MPLGQFESTRNRFCIRADLLLNVRNSYCDFLCAVLKYICCRDGGGGGGGWWGEDVDMSGQHILLFFGH